MDPSIHETARAKINLALHVTGRRADGYHLLDSLVTFAEAGDGLSFASSATDRLTLGGRFGARLDADGDNLVVKARDLSEQAYRAGSITLTDVLDADSQLLTARDELDASRANAARAAVGVYRALGGGWTPGPSAGPAAGHNG